MNDPSLTTADYDADADFAGSIADCYAAIRTRVAAGGKMWAPPPADLPPGCTQRMIDDAIVGDPDDYCMTCGNRIYPVNRCQCPENQDNGGHIP